ncbi:MAG: hypothetical protein MUC36_28855 [Planctomycetes bacterium]|nr:hypothetical protein [Planctomycetota bacterium]
MASADGGAAVGAVPSGGLATAMAGAAAAASVLAAASIERAWLPFGADAASGWGGAAVVAIAGAVVARAWLRGGRPPGWIAAAAMGLQAGAALTIGIAGVAGSGAACLLVAPAIGAQLAVAVPANEWRSGLAASFGALCLVASWWLAAAAGGPGALLAAAMVLQVVGWCAAVATERRRPSSSSSSSSVAASWARRSAVVGVALLALLVLPGLMVPHAAGVAGASLLVTAIAVAAAVGARRGLAAVGLVLAAVVWLGPVPTTSAAQQSVVANGGAEVVYLRDRQELQLRAFGMVVEATGPDRDELPLLCTLLQSLGRPGDRVLLFGPSGGAAAAALCGEPGWEVDVVETRPSTAPLQRALRGHGPVLTPPAREDSPPSPRARTAGLFPALAGLGDGVRQVVVLAEPNGAPFASDPSRAESPAAHQALHAECRRVVGDGLVLQVLGLDLVTPPVLAQVLAAAAIEHPWVGLFVVGDAAVLVGAVAAPSWSRLSPFQAWPDDWRWHAHRAHLGEVADLQRALLGTVRPPANAAAPMAVAADATGRRGVVQVLHDWLSPVPPPPATPAALLPRWTAQRAELRAAETALRTLVDDPAGRAAAQDLAARWLPLGAPRAVLQAALGLGGDQREPLLTPAVAARRAHAMAPLLFQQLPPVLHSLPLPNQAKGELEDLSRLPPLPRLATLASGDTPLAVALRARFPSPCARALVQALATAPLPAAGQQALRELADPFVLDEAARVLVARGGRRELLALWRHDLPMPTAIEPLLRGGRDDRRALAAALRGRREASCHGVLAQLLEATEPELRLLAGEALWHAVGERVPYDPDWPQSARAAAAEQLRSLHNQKP